MTQRPFELSFYVVMLMLALLLPVRARGDDNWIVRPHTMGNQSVGEIRVGAGVACYRNGVTRPPSYLVTDIGKPGVPVPSKGDARLLHGRFRHLDPRELRFLYMRLAKPHLVVFLASLQSLCDPTHPPFKDLSGGCDDYYQPLEYGDRPTAAPDCV